MRDNDSGMDRRDFLRKAAGAALGGVALSAGGNAVWGAPGQEGNLTQSEGIPARKLPRSGKVLPVLGLGSAAFGGYDLEGFSPPARDEQIGVLRYAYEKGIRYFDTAHIYLSEPVIGEALRNVRDEVYLATKTHAVTRVGARRHVERSLRRLRTDVIDCVKLHVPNEYDVAMRVLDELEKLRGEGKMRFIGMSKHVHFELSYKLIDSGRLDEVLLARCYFPKGHEEIISAHNRESRETAIARAHQLDMNIIGMEALGGWIFGHHATQLVPDYDKEKASRLPGAAIRSAFSDRRFHIYVIGVSKLSDIDDNVKICSADLTLTDEDRALLAEFSAKVWSAERIRRYPEPYKYLGSPVYREPWR